MRGLFTFAVELLFNKGSEIPEVLKLFGWETVFLLGIYLLNYRLLMNGSSDKLRRNSQKYCVSI